MKGERMTASDTRVEDCMLDIFFALAGTLRDG
jgi:hypothetical protein